MMTPQPRRMTVLQLIPRLDVGGAEQGTLDIAAALVAQGHRALVMSAGGRMVEALVAAGAEHVSCNIGAKNPLAFVRNRRALAEVVKAEHVDIIHARSRVPAWIGLGVARSMARPFVTTFHDAYAGNNAVKRFYNGVMARGDRVIAISQFVRDHIVRTYPQAAERVVLIPRGIDFSRFRIEAVSGARMDAFRAQHALTPDRPLIILPARLSATKGHEVALRALALLPDRNFLCLMIGPDRDGSGYRDRMMSLARDLKLDRNVRFVETPDLPAAYAIADLVLSPSRKAEGFGRVPVEAQAMGVPVIATALGATAETVIDGETGWLVPAGDAEALARAIGRALALSPDARRRMAERGVAHVRAHFDVARMCAQTLAVYAALMTPGAE